MSSLARHDMLLLSDEGVRFAREKARKENPLLDEEHLARLICPDVPAIVKRQESPRQGTIEIGFSDDRKEDGTRIRAISVVLLTHIKTVITPFDVARLIHHADEKIQRVFGALCGAAESHGLECGIYGSLALQLVSGRPYFTNTSDYDIFLRVQKQTPAIEAFFKQSQAIAQTEEVKLDIEIDCGGGFGAKLQEVCSGQRTLLCKGLYSAELRRISDLFS